MPKTIFQARASMLSGPDLMKASRCNEITVKFMRRSFHRRASSLGWKVRHLRVR
jgi:hypothetical protein